MRKSLVNLLDYHPCKCPNCGATYCAKKSQIGTGIAHPEFWMKFPDDVELIEHTCGECSAKIMNGYT